MEDESTKAVTNISGQSWNCGSPIHWRTTKRLSSPNLIGIVRLANREASLRATDEIYWAEIIFQGKSFDEYKARERGRLTLRLLQYLDEPALEKQRQMPVPFQNGALLNLCNHFSFGPNADSIERNDDYEDDSDGDANPITDTADIPSHDLIRKVVQLSLLDPIVDIRRDEALRNQLEYSLLRLAKSATLDPGQLRSFAEALMYPVHCTQGPPGTGKSYLGVVSRKNFQGAVPAVSSAVATLLKLAETISVDDNDKALNVDDTEEKANESEDGESELVSVAPTVTPIEIVKRMLVAKPMLTNANIAVLHEGIKHYDPAIDPMEVLYQWISDSDEDEGNFMDAVQYDNGDEVEESEHLQHMRDVFEVEDDDVELIRPHAWHWDTALEERWNALFSVLNLWGDLNTRLQHAFAKQLEDLKVELQREILRANSRLYEGKSVIGGTITGCVDGPLLVSCFNSSTRKLEMIGDHMQLQPSVMGRIDFERVNKINISMFERLISAPQGNEVPSSVLSIQRRMRKSICDLTRSFYDDITTIEDHEVCGTKVIGGAKRKPGMVPLLDACEGGGREVPGVSPHVFFWTHSGRQERASVGLSRVNQQEAKMTCKLVQYLVHCGVPAKSIAVLTPYKGQLMLMRKMLMDKYGLKMMTKERDPRPVPSCFLSTVDRFQGDEADIVIISLVIDGKSRTPFVKLQNRMIVLLSRARLGYAESDNTEAVECTIYKGPRIGAALPICCPEHRESVALAKEERDLKLGFCTVVCSVELSCSHECGLMCHWPQVNMHNKNCSVEVESPCSRHPRVLKCSAVTASAARAPINEALKKYQCDIRVGVSLSCGHNQKMKCYSHTEVEAGRSSWPVCNKEAIAPYVYSECKHILKCTCDKFDRYSKGHAPPCTEKVEYTPSCQHTVTQSCHDRQDYTNQVRRYVCKEKVKVSLPRCGHETVVSCPTAETLKQWTRESCPTMDFVQEGESYGPKDYFCKRNVKFRRRCGHYEMVRCERAFELAQSPSRCQEQVVVSNPECGHECSMTCFEEKRLRDKVAQYSGNPDDIDPIETVNEGDSSNYRNYGLNVQCSHEVTIDDCFVANLRTRGASTCHLNKHLKEWQPWQAQMPSIQLLHDDSVVEDTLLVPAARPAALRSVLKDCTAPVRYRRTTTCGHDVEMKCCDAFKLLQGKQTPAPCSIRVLKQLNCGHEAVMKCSDEVAVWYATSPSKALLEFHDVCLDTVIKTRSVMSDQKLNLWSPETARILPDMRGVTHVTMSLSSKRDFLVRKVKLLGRFKTGLDSSAKWSSPLFLPLEIPVFVVLSRKLQGRDIDKFEMKDFGSQQTLNGIEVYEATQENFKRVVSSGKASVLFGHLYSAKSLKNPTDIPKNKGKNGNNIRTWLSRQQSHGYDALYRDAKYGKKGGAWIVWHPYALFPVHRVEITDANRETIVSCLPEKTQVIQQPLKISFNKPTGVTTEEEEKPANTQAPTVISDEDIDKLRVLSASVSPFFEKLNVWYPWDGKSLSTGAAEAIPQRMEKTLISKLSFVPLNAANTTQQNPKTPFGGIKYVQNLQAQGKLKEDGNLFLALELLAVRNQDISETRSKLEKYVTRVCGEECGYAHPLVIVALARLAVRLSQTDIQRKLLHIFTALYPEASSLWLNEAELQLLQTTINQATASGSIVSGSVSVEDKWESLKSRYGCRSQAMEDLLKLVGLKKVKHAAVNMFRNAMILQQLSLIQRKKNSMAFNYCFVGNPGTGKTTVARLFAKILNDSMIRRTNTFVECTAQQLKDDGAAEFRLKLRKASGGVLFIDEAYELDPAGDFKGKPIVAELLTAAEDKRDDLSIILAGYEDDIQKKLYAYNDGLPSRFEEVVFEDFDSQDLEIVWDGLAQDRGWEYEKAIAKVACRRLAKAAGRKGFGNARAVRKLFEQVVKEAIAREDFDGTLKFQTVDLLGDRPSTNPKLQAVLDEVEEKTGWHKIKEEMKKLVRISDENYERELKGQETVPVCLNRLFLGNPGTGKTTCAGYYGRVLKALYFLSNGEVVKKTAGDFIGNHVGESQTKTAQILDMSKGKVLVIDEAYNLNDNLYGKQVLDVLVTTRMLEMLRTHNPGLMRRFPPQYAFHFDDYTEHELLTQPNFGNAGAVEQLLKHAMGKAMSRPMVNGMTVLALEDVGVDVSGEKSKEQKDPVKLLDKLYRMDEIKEQLIQLRNQMIVADREGSGLPEVGHFVFRGSPGTGKTTVARVMAEILHGMGVLATPKLVETSGLDLTGEHVGQTKQKVTDKLGEAKGGLLFIDEAYELGKGVYGEEAMTTLVAAMTDPSYVGMVIIIAGYPKDMDQMLDRNVGLKSRFTRFIDFPDWEAQDAVVFLSEKAESENFDVESEAVLSLQKTFVELKKLSNFGNGRDAVRVWKELLQYRSQRVVNEPEEERTITESDADKAGEAILVARRGGGVPGKGVASDEDPMKILDELYRMDQIRNQLSRLKMEMAVAEREGLTRPEIGHFVFRGSPGTGKTTVARVMAQILHAMSALGTTKLVETSGLDLTGEYVGQTKAKVTEKLVEAKGGLLFIDEAYELGKGMYGEEAMTTLVAAMTDPSYAGMVIVIAGYPKDMDVMLNRNAGLKSRFTRFIDFPDWEAEDGVAFLQAKAEKEEIEWGHGAEGILYQTFVELKKLDGFGNGRDAVRVWKELLQCRAQRVFDSPEEIRTITGKDAAMAGEIVLAARRPPDGPVLSQSSLPSDNSMVRTQDQQPPQTQQPLSELIEWLEPEQVTLEEQVEEKEALSAAAEEIVEVDAEEDPYTDEIEKDGKVERDPDVSDEDWEELERAKEAHAAHQEALKRARDQATREEERRRAQAKLEEERRRAAAIQEKIRQICPCPAGFKWVREAVALLAAVAHANQTAAKYLLDKYCQVEAKFTDEKVAHIFPFNFVITRRVEKFGNVRGFQLVELCGTKQRKRPRKEYIEALKKIAALDSNLDPDGPGVGIFCTLLSK
ncbi:P-loop containing nucleoside triphosphate hydrolase [Phytophthora cactorum]|nr:P-loop containing nucleoside triphosphate hydrolase [Phytophthora cactorum]